jgi:uncharacterized Ntn-hydrolase superfamily protein
MAFSLVARCPRSEQIGIVLADSVIAAGARSVFLRRGVGGIIVQHRADPRLGWRGLELMSAGWSAEETVAQLLTANEHAQWRQIAVLGAAGDSATFTGARVAAEASEAAGQDACAIGGLLVTTGVPAAMLARFRATPFLPLAERLMQALEEGVRAGGSRRPIVSASLMIVERLDFPVVDLRVDRHPDPVAELRALWEEFAPLSAEIVLRALDPDNARLV